MANPLIVPTGQSTILSAVITGGLGPFTYQWHGYRDDGTEFNATFSDTTAAQPQVALVFPGTDFYFFVVVTDNGIPVGQPGRTLNGFIRVHEADDALARLTVVGGPFHANTTDVTFDATASTGVITPVGWTLQYIGDVPPPDNIEEYLTLESGSNGTLSWTTIYSTISDQLTLTVDKSVFAAPGAYRMLIQTNGDIGTHQTWEYFMVGP
jgi:hypothetical protein